MGQTLSEKVHDVVIVQGIEYHLPRLPVLNQPEIPQESQLVG